MSAVRLDDTGADTDAGPPAALRIDLVVHSAPPTVTLAGRFEAEATAAFAHAMTQARSVGRDVVLDVGRVTYIDPAGVEAIGHHAQILLDAGRSLVVTSDRPAVLDHLLKLGFGDLRRVTRETLGRPRR